MDRGLYQGEVAKLLDVTPACVYNWENKRSYPKIMHFPAIIAFLEYDPLEVNDGSLAEILKSYRKRHGISVKKLAPLIGVDEQTLHRLENKTGKVPTFQKTVWKIEEYLHRTEI